MAASARVPRQSGERSQPTLWAVATISFLVGSAATALVIWQLNRLYQATIAPLVSVEGKVQAKYSNQSGDGPTPAPIGYFIESSGTGRVYLTNQPLNAYVGKTVEARGSVTGICGPKSIPCYPIVKVREVSIVEETEQPVSE